MYIAVSIFDRFLSQVFIHKFASYSLVAAAAAFIAVKFNEEFDPEALLILKTAKLSACFNKKELLNMERRIFSSLDWNIRPVTPHVVAYKILDNLHGYYPLGFKRFVVHVIERIMLSSLCSYPFQDWSFKQSIISATCFALRHANEHTPLVADIAIPGLGCMLGLKTGYELENVISDEDCRRYAYLPIVYGDPIQLVSSSNPECK